MDKVRTPMKAQKKNRHIIIVSLLVFSICVMAFSGYKLWETQQVYAVGDRLYDELTDEIRTNVITPGGGQETEEAAQGGQMVGIPAMMVDFTALRAMNEDAAAWLYCPETEIDYPVMQATDYDWYLHHLPDGTENANGTLFLDYNNPSDFSGQLNIIYGHNMKSGMMFGSLTQYKEQAYFDEHPYLYLYTAESGNFRIDLVYGCVVDAGEWRNRAFMYETNLQSLLDFCAHNTTFESGVACTDEDRFVVLSTCSYEFDDARYVVLGVLRPEFGEE